MGTHLTYVCDFCGERIADPRHVRSFKEHKLGAPGLPIDLCPPCAASHAHPYEVAAERRRMRTIEGASRAIAAVRR